MEKVRIQDDLYQHVNGEWIEKAVIPADRPTTGGFADLDQDVEKLLMQDFKDFSEGKIDTDIKEMQEAIKLYKKVLDVKRRNEEGIKPVLNTLNIIKNVKDIKDLNDHIALFVEKGINFPFYYGVTTDMQDATKNSFVMIGPSIILPDTTYYQDDNEMGKKLIGVYKDMITKILAYTDLSKEEQAKFISDTLEFDRLVSKSVKSQLEWADYVKAYNPTDVDVVKEELKPFDFDALMACLYPNQKPTKVIVYDPRAIKEFSKYYNNETFDIFRSWLYVKTLVDACKRLSEELYELSTIYQRATYGIQENPVLEKQAYKLASQVFSEPIGMYYGRKYFGEEAKKDVIDLVKKIIETYKLRMKKNTFLEEATKEKAIKKLSTIEIKMGYPDKVNEIFTKFKIEDSESLYETMVKVDRIVEEDNRNKLFKKVDREEWLMPGHMVNACYNPMMNDITFPAAILQKPFYSIKQSLSENLGGIGAVIAHEISHAFDNNGAHFDEFGNLNNWWSEKDFKAFEALTEDMVKQWNGIEYHGGKVNGRLVVSENIADNGGMGVTLEIMHTLKNPDFKAYFINWAKVWCRKAKEEYILQLLNTDVHSPAELRANMQVKNFSEWYEAFDVKSTDKMFIEEDKRISIW